MNNAFESIQQGLMEAIEFGKGETKDATVHKSSSDEAKRSSEFASTLLPTQLLEARISNSIVRCTHDWCDSQFV